MLDKVRIDSDNGRLGDLTVALVDSIDPTVEPAYLSVLLPVTIEITANGTVALLRVPVEAVNFEGNMR